MVNQATLSTSAKIRYPLMTALVAVLAVDGFLLWFKIASMVTLSQLLLAIFEVLGWFCALWLFNPPTELQPLNFYRLQSRFPTGSIEWKIFHILAEARYEQDLALNAAEIAFSLENDYQLKRNREIVAGLANGMVTTYPDLVEKVGEDHWQVSLAALATMRQ